MAKSEGTGKVMKIHVTLYYTAKVSFFFCSIAHCACALVRFQKWY